MVPSNIIEVAHRCALKSCHRFRLGAVIFKGTRILGIGWNKPKTHPRANTPYNTIHSEFAAVLKVVSPQALKKASLYVHRVGRDQLVHLAKPCKHCSAMLAGIGLNDVFYSIDGLEVGRQYPSGSKSFDYGFKSHKKGLP